MNPDGTLERTGGGPVGSGDDVSRIEFFARIQSKDGFISAHKLVYLTMKASVGTCWKFKRAPSNDGYYISVRCNAEGAPGELFLYVDKKVLKVRIGSGDVFDLRNSALLHVASCKYVCPEKGQLLANREVAGKWEAMKFERAGQGEVLEISMVFAYSRPFSSRIVSTRTGKNLGVKHPSVKNEVVMGDKLYCNWEFKPVPNKNCYRISLLIPESHGSGLWSLSRLGDGNLVVSEGEGEEFQVEADETKTCLFRHVESNKILSCDGSVNRCLKVNRDVKDSWESFTINRALAEDPALVLSSSNLLSNTVRKFLVDKGKNEAWISTVLTKEEPMDLWKAVKLEDSVEEAKKAAQDSGKPLLMLLMRNGPSSNAVTCLGSRLWKAHVFSDAAVISTLTSNFVCVFVNVGEADIPVKEFPCLADLQKQFELVSTFPVGKRMFDAVCILSVPSSGKSALLALNSMMTMTDFENGFSVENFLALLQKHEKKRGKLAKLVSSAPKADFTKFVQQMPIHESKIEALEKLGLGTQ